MGLNTFGRASGREASVWQLDPLTSQINRIAEIDRSVVVPAGSNDNNPEDLGNWEPSGILDVTNLFQKPAGVFDVVKTRKRILIGSVQAHSIRDGIIGMENLGEGGQLVIFEWSGH